MLVVFWDYLNAIVLSLTLLILFLWIKAVRYAGKHFHDMTADSAREVEENQTEKVV